MVREQGAKNLVGEHTLVLENDSLVEHAPSGVTSNR